MLFHTLAAPGAGMYVEQYSCVIHGPLRAPLLKAAWEQALRRHPALRTAVLWQDLDEPLQVVREQVDAPWTTHDWRDCAPKDIMKRWKAFLAADRAQGFQLMQAPLWRVALIRTGESTHRLVWTFHHVLLDGWSAVTVLREIWTDYAARCSGDAADMEVPRPFRDYVAWHRARDLDAEKAYWTEHLRGFLTPTPLHLAPSTRRNTAERADSGTKEATDSPEHATSRGECQRALSAEETAAAQDYAKRHRITLNTLVQGAWALLLSRYSGEDDVAYGTTVAARPSSLRGVESMVGAFINTVPMRVPVRSEAPPGDWLHAVQSTLSAARSHAYAPLGTIQKWSPVPSGKALFDSLLVFENHPPAKAHPAEAAGLRVEESTFQGQSNYPLAVLALPGPQLRFTAVYDASRFSGARIERVLDHLTTLIGSIATGSADQLVDCAMLHADECRSLPPASLPPESISPEPLPPAHQPSLSHVAVMESADPSSERDSIYGIHQLIEQVAQSTPEADAVRFEDETLTYAALNAQAGALATRLTGQGVVPGDRVGLFVERSPAMVVGILAILKAGGAYVPLDPTYPRERLQHMLGDSGARVLLTTRALASGAPGDTNRMCIDEPSTQEAAGSHPNGSGGPAPPSGTASEDELAGTPDQPAYVIYTSGSTGTPKGVVVTHANLLFSTRARAAYYPEPPSAFLLLSPFGFDSSVAGIFWTLSSGGTLVLPRPGDEKEPRRLAHLIERHGVTHTLCVPALYGLLLDQVTSDSKGAAQKQRAQNHLTQNQRAEKQSTQRGPGSLAALKAVIVAGEACPPALPARHHATLPGCALFNEDGTTETTVWATVHRVPPETPHQSIPIGRPIPGATAYVLDAHRRVVPPGVPGELYIGGPGVTPGYLNRPNETDKRFLPLPLGPADGPRSDRAPRRIDSPGQEDPADETDTDQADTDQADTGPRKDRLAYEKDRLSEAEDRLSQSEAGLYPTSERLYRTGDRVRADEQGVLEFLGRVDNQVKVRGHRIEIGEIETALLQHGAVETGAVVMRDVNGQRQLVAYVVPVPAARSTDQENQGALRANVRSALRASLPDYMVPAHIEFAETLPRTPNGKIDRDALPAPSPRRAVDEADTMPTSPVEMQMLTLWQDVLDQRPLSMTDNFFDLGGDSLLAMTLTARIEDLFGIPVSTSSLFDHPTPQALSEKMRAIASSTESSTESPTLEPETAESETEESAITEPPSTQALAVESPVAIRARGTRPPLFCVPGSGGYPILFHKLSTYLKADQPVYSFQPEGVDGRALPRTRIESMAEQHLTEMKSVQAEGPYHLCGFSVGGLVAYEMAHQLAQSGETVSFVGLLDTRIPQESGFGRWWTRFKDDIKYWIRRREAQAYLRAGRVMPRALRNSFPAKVHERAARRYRPPSYTGPVDLFAATGTPDSDPQNAAAWEACIEGPFIVHEIPASHDLVKEPYVQDLAERLTGRLSE